PGPRAGQRRWDRRHAVAAGRGAGRHGSRCPGRQRAPVARAHRRDRAAAMSAPAGNFSQAEVDKFDELAHRWWDPQGPQKALHALNPARLGYVAGRTELRGACVVEVGCGGGWRSEALAVAGASVTAIDLAPGLLKVARLHGLESGVTVDYRLVSVEALAAEAPASFDAIT